MHTSLSKKLLAGLLSLVMVLSLVAPGTSAQAATKYSLTDKKSVKSGVTFKYELKGVSKGCYVKVTRNLSGEKVVYNKKELTKTTKVNGTGKTLNLYVTYGEKDENYTGKFTVKVYGKKTNKCYKTLVEEVTVKVPEKEVVASVSINNATPKVGDTLSAVTTPEEVEIASYVWYADGVAIADATGSTYTVAETDLAKKISVSATDSLGNTVTSEATAAVVEADKTALTLTAKQTGAATIEVVASEKLTNDDAITVTRGTTEQTITKAFSEDGKTVTLTLATAITASDYVIKVVPKDTSVKEASVTVTGEKAVLTTLKFESDKLVMLDNAGTKASVVINGYDQFESRVAISGSNTTFYATGAVKDSYTSDTGVLVLKQQGSAYPFTVGQTVQVTAVYNNGTQVLQQVATLTVSAAAYVKTLEFGALTTSNSDLKDKRVTIDNFSDNSYYYPITATNQYDQKLTATDLTNMVNNKTLIVSPTDTGYAYVDSFDTLKDGTVIAKVKKGTATLVPTTVPISIISVGGGSFTQNLVIEDNPYIASLDVSIPEVYSGIKTEISVSAKDQNGDAYDFYADGTNIVAGDIIFGDTNTLASASSSIDATNGTFSMVKDTTKKTVQFYYTCTNNGKSALTDTVAVKTATPSLSSIKVTVNVAGKTAKVQGIASGVTTTIASGKNIKLGTGNEKNVVFLDNYGAVMTTGLPTFNGTGTGMTANDTFYYTVKVDGTLDADGTLSWSDYEYNHGAANAGTKDVNRTVTISLYKGNGTEAELINSVDVTVKFEKSSVTYAVGLNYDDLMFVDASSTDDDSVWVAKYVDGVFNKYLGATEFTLSDDLGLTSATGSAIDASAVGNLPDNTTGKDVIYVTVDGSIVGNIILNYSNVEAVAEAAYFVKEVGGGYTTAADKITIAATNYTFNAGLFTISDGTATYTLAISDQYGQDVTSGVTVKLNGNKLTENVSTANTYLLTGGSENTVTISKGNVTKTVYIVVN